MKKYLSACICIICLLCMSCENKWPKNGYLDGMWQIMSIEHLGTNVYTYDENNPPADKEIRYISFQLSLFELSVRGQQDIFYGYFQKVDNKMRLYQVSNYAKYENQNDDNALIPDSLIKGTIRPWGLYKSDNTFTILKLTEDKMTLQSDSALIHLRKF